MHDVFMKLLILLELLIGVVCIYGGLIFVLASGLYSIILIAVGIFVIVVACGHIDEVNGYGKNNDHKQEDS